MEMPAFFLLHCGAVTPIPLELKFCEEPRDARRLPANKIVANLIFYLASIAKPIVNFIGAFTRLRGLIPSQSKSGHGVRDCAAVEWF